MEITTQANKEKNNMMPQYKHIDRLIAIFSITLTTLDEGELI